MASTALGLDQAPRLNGPFSFQALPSARMPAATGMMYEIYRNTAQPAASTENACPYRHEMKASAALTQMAITGVRYCGLTRLSADEAGRPPSREKAYIMREVEVS